MVVYTGSNSTSVHKHYEHSHTPLNAAFACVLTFAASCFASSDTTTFKSTGGTDGDPGADEGGVDVVGVTDPEALVSLLML